MCVGGGDNSDYQRDSEILKDLVRRLEAPSNFTGLHSAVGNVSDYRYVSDCRSRGR